MIIVPLTTIVLICATRMTSCLSCIFFRVAQVPLILLLLVIFLFTTFLFTYVCFSSEILGCLYIFSHFLTTYVLFCIYDFFLTYVLLHVIFISLFYFFKIARFLLITSTAINTKLTCIITDFTIIFWLAKFLSANINTKLTCIHNSFTTYFTSAPNNDITRRVVMFP